MVDEPLQSVCDEASASFGSLRSEFSDEVPRALTNLLCGALIFSCEELGDWHIQSCLKGECRGKRRRTVAAFVLGDLSTALATDQIRDLGLTEPGPFSIRSQVIVEFWKSHWWEGARYDCYCGHDRAKSDNRAKWEMLSEANS